MYFRNIYLCFILHVIKQSIKFYDLYKNFILDVFKTRFCVKIPLQLMYLLHYTFWPRHERACKQAFIIGHGTKIGICNSCITLDWKHYNVIEGWAEPSCQAIQTQIIIRLVKF